MRDTRRTTGRTTSQATSQITDQDPTAWPTGRLLSTAARLVERAWAEHLSRLGVTHAGLVTLHVLAAGPLSQRQLADRCEVQAQTMSRILARLERAGLVRRDPDPSDARKRMVRSTTAGTRVLREAVESRPDVVRMLDDGDQSELFRQHLVEIVRHLGHDHETGGP